MSLKSLQLGQALRLVARTLPIAGVRLGVTLAFWLGALIYVGAVGALAFLAARVFAWLGVVIGLIGLGAMVWLVTLAQRYVLYLVKAAQIAVMARMLTGDAPPGGASQLQWGREQVASRFGEVSGMFVVDQVVSAVVRGFTRLVYGLVSWLPGDALRGLARVAGRLVHYAVTYIDEAILARTFWLDDGTVWANVRDGVALYAMVWKPLLVNALALMGLSYIPGIVVVALLAMPFGWLGNAISPQIGGWSIVAALVIGWAVKVAVGDSLAMAAIIAAYQRSIQGLRPDPAMLERLGHVPRFEELAQRVQDEAATRRLDPRDLPSS
ncbi:MAG: hypothetical protein ACYCYF_05775 [Anaerolineae bacterium]